MKKLITLACVLSISFLGNAQIEVDSNNKTGIGTRPADARLTVGGDHNTLIRLLNGNSHAFSIGNYHHLYGAVRQTH